MTELDDAAKCDHFDQAAHFDATQTENFPAWNFGPVYTEPGLMWMLKFSVVQAVCLSEACIFQRAKPGSSARKCKK